MKKQTIGYMAAYNEAEYIEYSVRSVIDHVDHMVVIEGAFKETVESGGFLRSDDGTIEILNKLEKEFDNLTVFQTPKPMDQIAHRNASFAIIGYKCPLAMIHGFWLWLIDADEVYDEENIGKLKGILETTKADVVKIDSLTFVNDPNSYVRIAFPRVFRILGQGQHAFVAPNHVARFLPAPRVLLNDKEQNYEDDVRFFHYSYMKHPERFLLKKKERERVHGQFKWSLNNEDQVVCPGTNIRTFQGKHPAIMKDHPKFDGQIFQ